jgi:hypothetical protein
VGTRSHTSQSHTSVTHLGVCAIIARAGVSYSTDQISLMKGTQGCTWASTTFTRQLCPSFKLDSPPLLRHHISDVEPHFPAPLGMLVFQLLRRPLRLPYLITRLIPRTSSCQHRIALIACTILALEHRKGRHKPSIACSSLHSSGNATCAVLRDRSFWCSVHHYEFYWILISRVSDAIFKRPGDRWTLA